MIKKLIKRIVIWLLKMAEIDNILLPSKKESCGVIKDGKFLYLTMPDGTVIPKQKDFILTNNVEDRGMCHVQITVTIPLNDNTPNRELYNLN